MFTDLSPGKHVHVITLTGTHYDATVSTNDGILTSLLLDDEYTTATILVDSVRDVTLTTAPLRQCYGLSSVHPHPFGSRLDDCPECETR